ncbi:hypothetical protein FB45DRAFT_838535, partial [Roridomyces roridus]
MLCFQCGAAVDLTSARMPPTISYSIREELLTSNLCPLDSEIPSIKRLLADPQPRVEALNAQIGGLQAALANLVRERDDLVSHAERYRAVLSPIRRVPPELVAEVFRLVPFTRKIQNKTVTKPPWTLGHICSSWRETALGCPLLWRSFTLTTSNFRSEAMITAQLPRTANVPLLVNFEWNNDADGGACALLGLLLPHSSRWQSLRIRCHHHAAAEIVLESLQVIKGRISQLEKLEFFVGRTVHPTPSNKWEMFSISPRLSEVLLTEVLWHGYSPQFSIPWSQIRNYRAVLTSIQQLDILSKSPNLVGCSIGFDDALSTHGDTMVVLPLLRRLSVEGSSILDHITAPSLEHL